MDNINRNLTHLVLDFETLGFAETAVVTRIACTPFKFGESNITYDELVERSLYIALDKDEQIKLGRTYDKPTLTWWSKQAPELIKESTGKTSSDLKLKDALDIFKKYTRDHSYKFKESFIWARGTYFECPKFENMCKMIYPDSTPFLNTFKFHECRTFNWLLTGGITETWEPEKIPNSFVKHHAKHDAAMDAYRLIKLFN